MVVRVCRHDYVVPDMKIMLAPSPVERVYKPLAGSVFAEELVLLITGERELVGVIG